MRKKILVIEDNPAMLDNVIDILTLANYEALAAFNGKTGVELAKKHLPDLILCDIMMPELDGYGVMYILNRNPETASIPFVFLTAKAEPADFRIAMNLGADDYVTKPFESSDLLNVVETRLRKNELIKKGSHSNLQDLNNFFIEAKEVKEFEKLSATRPTRHVKKREFIFMEGQNPTDLYFIVSGEVKTYKVNYEGKELITGIHHPGDFIGYVALLEGLPYNENAMALTDTTLSMINHQDFLTLVYSDNAIARKFIRMLSDELIENENRLLDLAYQSVRQRVASALLRLQLTEPSEVITIARKDISNIVGTATESLNRTIADFVDEGLVEIVEHGLRIRDKSRLEKMLR